MENIKYYPKSYTMPEELKRFLTKVTNDTDLQKQLYNTKILALNEEDADKVASN